MWPLVQLPKKWCQTQLKYVNASIDLNTLTCNSQTYLWMILNVISLSGPAYIIHIEPTQTIGDVKDKLEEEAEIPREHQKLKYKEVELEDYNTVGSYHITPGAMVRLMVAIDVEEEPDSEDGKSTISTASASSSVSSENDDGKKKREPKPDSKGAKDLRPSKEVVPNKEEKSHLLIKKCEVIKKSNKKRKKSKG